MRILLLLSFFLSTIFSTAQSREDSLKNLSIEWMNSLERKDSVALEGFLAKDYTLSTVGESDYVDRPTWMKNAIGKTWGNTSYQFKGVTFEGNQGIVNSIMSFTVKPIPFTMRSETLDHWIYQDGRWMIRTRYLGENSITNFIKTVKGFLFGVAFILVILLFNWYTRKRKK